MLRRYVVLVAALALSAGSVRAAVDEAAVATDAVTSELDAQASNGRLRGLLRHITGETDALASGSDEKAPALVKEIVPQWTQSTTSAQTSELSAVEKIIGGEAIVVFFDRAATPETKAESSVVTFDVRSRANCVVSVCGLQRNWYMRNEERCFDLRIAQKSADESENGFIRGISAAYSSVRPVASKLYLKFDATNFIDERACEYEIVSGSKTVTEEAAPAGSSSTIALS